MTTKVRKDKGGKNGILVVRPAGRPTVPAVGDSIDTADRIRGRVTRVAYGKVYGDFVRGGSFMVKVLDTIMTKDLPKGRRQFWAPNSSKIAVAQETSAPVAVEVEDLAMMVEGQ